MGRCLPRRPNDFTVRLWNVATGALTRTLQAIDDVAAVAFAPDGKSLAAADEKGMLSVWDVGTGERFQSMAFEQDFLLSLAYSPDGRSVAVAGKTRTIRLWDPVTGQELLSLDGHKAQVNGLAFSPDGSVLASCSHDGAVKLWRAKPSVTAQRAVMEYGSSPAGLQGRAATGSSNAAESNDIMNRNGLVVSENRSATAREYLLLF